MLIAQITDAHVGPAGQLFYDRVDTGAALSAAVAALNAMAPRPDIVLFTGDLGDKGTAEEYDHIAARLAPLEIPLVVVPGNHDRRGPFRAAFAGNDFLPDGDGPLHQVIDAFPVRLIGLDTLDEAGTDGSGRIDAAGCAWLEARLAEAPERPTVVFMHHPPFATGIGHMDAIACRGAEALAEVIARHPQVERVLCGHVHRPVTLRWAGTVASIAPSVAHQVALELREGRPSAFVLEPPALQLHLWLPGQGLVSHTRYIGDHGPAISYATGAPL